MPVDKPSKHSVEILQAGSRYVGRKCPATRTKLGVGDQVVVCHKRDEVFSWNALPVLEGRCPFCEQQIAFEEAIDPSEKPIQPDKKKTTKPTAGPDYAPAQGRSGIPPVLIALVILGLIGVCGIGIGGAIGYPQFFAQPTVVPTVAPVVDQATEVPTTMKPTTDSPSAIEASSPTRTPRPISTPRPTSTKESSPTPMPSATPCSITVAPRFAAAWNQYAEELGCPISQAHTHESASQDFERGFLLWRINPDQVYVMYDDGRLGFYPMSVYPESVRQNPSGGDPNIQPPAGFQQPVRGFGLIWRDNPEVRDGLGWAIEREARADWYYGFEAQDFAKGTVLHECRMGVRVLLSSGTWIKVSEGEPCN